MKKAWYRLLSHILFGNMKKKYKEKYKSMKKEKVQIQQVFCDRYIMPPKIKEVLVVFLDAIGDYILFRNFLLEIKNSEKFKGYRINLLGCEKFKEFALFLDDKIVDKFLWVPHRPQDMSSDKLEDIRKKLHANQGMSHYYDTIILASYNSAGKRSAIELLLKYVAFLRKIIYIEWRNPKVHDPNNFLNYTYCYVNHSDAFKKFEFDLNKDFWEDILEKKINLSYPKINLSNVPSIYNKDKNDYVVINPCAQDGYRQWNLKNYIELIDYFISRGLKVILCCSKSEENYCKLISRDINTDIEIRAGLSIQDLFITLKKSKLYIGQDSGLFHFAAAMDIKALCLSAGNAYFRFMNYPKNRKNIRVLFPNGIENEIKENPMLVVDHKGFFINSIKVKDVIINAEELINL